MHTVTIAFVKHGEPPLVVPENIVVPRGQAILWHVQSSKVAQVCSVVIEFEAGALYFGGQNRRFETFLDKTDIVGFVPNDRDLTIDKYTVIGTDACGCRIELDPTVIVTDP